VKDRTFYIFHSGSNRLFRTEDGGRNWRSEPGPVIDAGSGTAPSGAAHFTSEVTAGAYDYNSKLKAMPGLAGHLCLTDGGAQPLRCTTNAGASWLNLPGTSRVTHFAFGKAAAGKKLPTIFIQGYVKDSPGIWCSIDLGRNWGSLGRFPLGLPARAQAMDGDRDVFGTLYIGTTGNGFIVGKAKAGKTPEQLCGAPAL
jgi:hypothetical protein